MEIKTRKLFKELVKKLTLELLDEESLEEMDAFIAVTENSETNIMSCLMAKSHGIKKTFNEHIENKRNWQNKIWTVLVYINWRKNNFN